MKNIQSKIEYYKILAVLLGAALILSIGAEFIVSNNNSGNSIIETVSAQEIYPLFYCPCCGQQLDKDNICCEMSQERIDYINSLIETKTSEKEIILAYVQEYGLNSFIDESKQEEFRNELVENAPVNRPIIFLAPETYDFGDVSQKKGDVTTFFELKNKGKTDLVINKLETSCGCTSASIVYKNNEGPIFNMPGHGINEEIGDWEITLSPGEKAQLKVYYNPNMHKDFRGTAIREIYVFSNDSIDFKKKVSIEVNQID
ncbi:MAG TPA: DUF1573 domain-containing protein [bacterium]|nr:DUF1573 domain-containing protein [bacterium]